MRALSRQPARRPRTRAHHDAAFARAALVVAAEPAVTGVVAKGQIEVPVRTLDDIIDEAGPPAGIDFLSIDVEGHELEVLRGFDFARWRPRLILIEDHLASLAVHRTLQRHGYRLIRRTGLNGWYVPQVEAPALGLGQWQLLRKYYLAQPFRILRDRNGGCATDFGAGRPANTAARLLLRCSRSSMPGDLDVPRLSAIIITKNEAKNIAACLIRCRFAMSASWSTAAAAMAQF